MPDVLAKDTVELRGHHLLCILTYIGAGYTPYFIENFDAIVERINHGAPIKIVAGPDSICAALRQGAQITCQHAKNCRGQSIRHRDRLALQDVARALQMPILKTGDTLIIKRGEVRHLRQYFAHGAIRRACMNCSWHSFCSQVVADKFAGVKLLRQAVPRP